MYGLDAMTTSPTCRLTVNLAPLLNGSPKSADGTALLRFHFATDLCDSKAIPGRPNTRAQGDASATGKLSIAIDLHQTFATPDGLILLRFLFVANLSFVRHQVSGEQLDQSD